MGKHTGTFQEDELVLVASKDDLVFISSEEDLLLFKQEREPCETEIHGIIPNWFVIYKQPIPSGYEYALYAVPEA